MRSFRIRIPHQTLLQLTQKKMAGGAWGMYGGKKKGLQNFDEGNPKNEVTCITEDMRQ